MTEGHSNFKPVQLHLDPIGAIEEVDSILGSRQPGTRPGQRLLLTLRRDIFRSLAAELSPRTSDTPSS